MNMKKLTGFIIQLILINYASADITYLNLENTSRSPITFDIETTNKRLSRRGENGLSFEGLGTSVYSKRIEIPSAGSYRIDSFNPNIDKLTFIYKNKNYKFDNKIMDMIKKFSSLDVIRVNPTIKIKVSKGFLGDSLSFNLDSKDVYNERAGDALIIEKSYKNLGLKNGASVADIKSAYTALTDFYDPNKFEQNKEKMMDTIKIYDESVTKKWAQKRLREVNEAYKELKAKLFF